GSPAWSGRQCPASAGPTGPSAPSAHAANGADADDAALAPMRDPPPRHTPPPPPHRTVPPVPCGREEQRTFHDARRIGPWATGVAGDNYGRTARSAMHRRRPSAMRDAAAAAAPRARARGRRAEPPDTD